MKLATPDAGIVRELQRDGRLTNIDLATKLHISESSCLRKTRALEKAGIITGYRAIVDPEAMGYALSAYVLVNLDQRSETDSHDFFRSLSEEEQILDCIAITGVSDLILRVVARDKEDLARLTMDRILHFPSVKDISTCLILREIKAGAPIPA